MTGKDLKIWMINNDFKQATLAKKLGVSLQTISNYCTSKPPLAFKYTLAGLEIELKKDKK